METKTTEAVFKSDAKRLWIAAVKDSHNILPLVSPDVFSSVTLSNGSGGPGTIKHITLGPKALFGAGGCIKHKVEVVDDENMVYKYSIVEGGPIGKTLKSVTFELKLEARSDGGCVGKNTCTFERMEGVQSDPSKLKHFEEAADSLAQAVDAYLLAHPHLYV